MAKETFYVKIETPKGTGVYSFTRSETGILDFAGETDPAADELAQMQSVEGSALLYAFVVFLLAQGIAGRNQRLFAYRCRKHGCGAVFVLVACRGAPACRS